MEVWNDMQIMTYRVGPRLILVTVYTRLISCGTGVLQKLEATVHVL